MTRAEIPLKVGQRKLSQMLHFVGLARLLGHTTSMQIKRGRGDEKTSRRPMRGVYQTGALRGLRVSF